MTTATLDEAVANVAADTKKQPLDRGFYKGVSFAIFPKTIKREDGTEATIYSTNIEGRYKDKNGEHQSTSWYDENQLAVVEDFARQARRLIREQKSKQRAEEQKRLNVAGHIILSSQ